MSTIQIDRLLDTVVKEGAADLHLTVGRPPTVRLHGHLVNLKTKVLDSDDMVSLMKSITPERNQQELQEVGGTAGAILGDWRCRRRAREIYDIDRDRAIRNFVKCLRAQGVRFQ